MEQQHNDTIRFPFEDLLKRKGTYFMLLTTFNECLEGKYSFINKDQKLIERKVSVAAARFQAFINRSDVSIKTKNGFAIFKKV